MSQVRPGKLKLKGETGVRKTSKGGKKKEKRKEKEVVERIVKEQETSAEKGDQRDAERIEGAERGGETVRQRGETQFTTAELRFMMKQAERKESRVEKAASKTHRERIEEMNKDLASRTEHNEMAKVTPG